VDPRCVQEALDGALTEILWRCASTGNNKIIICQNQNNFTAGAPLLSFSQQTHLKDYIRASKLDCISFIYSAVLSRGLDNILTDIDFEGSSLIGQYGYCSQELMNLLLIGIAHSNAFDNQIHLDGKILKGVPIQSDIGFLSLYEHYGSYQVRTSYSLIMGQMC